MLTEYGPGPWTCSREYCRPYLGTECAELLSLNIRGLQGRDRLTADTDLGGAQDIQQAEDTRCRARVDSAGIPRASHLSLHP